MTQAAMFNLDAGETAKEKGLASVANNNAEWLEAIRYHARLHSKYYGSVTSDDLRRYAELHKLWPLHPNAWGAVFKGQGWKVVGRTKSEVASNHGREIRVWKWVTP